MTARKKYIEKSVTKSLDDRVEQTQDNVVAAVDAQKVTKNNSAAFPIVGIGASAGGLSSFEAFFTGMPLETDPNMAFVIVQHLDPNHKSLLTELIRRYTRMHVFEVKDGMEVQPNCTYIIPPNKEMTIFTGKLQLLEPSASSGKRMSIDFFFKSLALDQHDKAIGIVLSGTGSDGTLGLRAIKSEGGMVMVQSPASAEYDGMPLSAIDTGLVDYILPPAEMPAQLIAYLMHTSDTHLPDVAPSTTYENALNKIFILLRTDTGHDFSQYKLTTVNRRIGRRMAIHQIKTIHEYVKYMQQDPEEAKALFRDLLIGVTNFFRDKEAFEFLAEQVIPRIFARKEAGEAIRVWSPGCATGEEAYSLAILFAEYQAAQNLSYKVQIFATDIDNQALETARSGIYPVSIANDVSPERLESYFKLEPDGSAYRIQTNIRDMLIFSEQDVIKDPPFSRLDMISCRNLLIYMSGELQNKLIPIFQYALNPGGFLFLGTSETIGDFGDFFVVVDRKFKLYQCKENIQCVPSPFLGNFALPMIAMDSAHSRVPIKMSRPRNISLRELTEQALCRHFIPAAALVNCHGDILYIHGRTGMYLEPAEGEVGVANILKMAREGLRYDLAKALKKVVETRDIVRCLGLRVKTNGDFTTVDLTLLPVINESTTSLYLLVMEAVQPVDHEQAQQTVGMYTGSEAERPRTSTMLSSGMDTDERIIVLKRELQAKEEFLQAANEELQSSNEEMQSMNEELQSTNEELETSKEELQSVNEELFTVNAELQAKVADLSQANNDMNNLLAGSGIGTLFVDMHMIISNFTPDTTKVINLIPTDIGRPVGHIASNLINYDNLLADTQSVLDSLIPREVEVQTKTGTWYLMHIRPYRTLNNVIEGAVITFVDITKRKLMEAELYEKELLQMQKTRLFEAIVNTMREPLLVLNADLRVISANRAFYDMFKLTEDVTIGQLLYNLGNHQWDIPALRKLLEEILLSNVVFNDYEIKYEFENIGLRTIHLNARHIVNELDYPDLILLAIQEQNGTFQEQATSDITDMQSHQRGAES